MSRPLPPPDECAACGADLPRHVHACPECGADERTGWREQSIYDGLDLPGSDEENDKSASARPRVVNGLAWYWWCVGVALLLLLICGGLALR